MIVGGIPVGSWAEVLAAFLTGGSLLLGFYILLRDRRKEESAQAAQIICWVSTIGVRPEGQPRGEPDFGYTVHVSNDSQYPILTPELRIWRFSTWDVLWAYRITPASHLKLQLERAREQGEAIWEPMTPEGVLFPGQSVHHEVHLRTTIEVCHIYVEFSDGQGKGWARGIGSGAIERRWRRSAGKYLMVD